MSGHDPPAGSFLREQEQVRIRCRAQRGILEVGRPLRGSWDGFEGSRVCRQDSFGVGFPLFFFWAELQVLAQTFRRDVVWGLALSACLAINLKYLAVVVW